MTMRFVTLALAALLALHGVVADSDCLTDGATCRYADGCPPVCCSGLPHRTSGSAMYCANRDAALRGTTGTGSNGTTGTATAPTIAASTTTDPPSPTEGNDVPTSGSSAIDDNAAGTASDSQAPAPIPAVEETQPPSSTGTTSSVDAFQNTDTISNSRGGSGSGGAASGIVIAVGALAGCVVLVAAVMYKRKTSTTQALEIPGSSYHGASGSGLTPDNRSLDGMMEGGARGSTESMKQLPVLSMAGRDGSSVVRLSSPFGQGTARISSPAHRGGTNEDYAFDVEMGSRAGSSVQVAFVDATHSDDAQSTEFVGDKPANGVVAL